MAAERHFGANPSASHAGVDPAMSQDRGNRPGTRGPNGRVQVARCEGVIGAVLVAWGDGRVGRSGAEIGARIET